MRGDTRGAFGWRVNRLSDRPTGLEVVGSACGYAFALLFVSAAAYMLFYARPSPWMVAAPIAGAIIIGALSSGVWSCIRFRFNTAGGPIERVACDSTELVMKIRIGDTIPRRYDPDDPRRVLIDAVR